MSNEQINKQQTKFADDSAVFECITDGLEDVYRTLLSGVSGIVSSSIQLDFCRKKHATTGQVNIQGVGTETVQMYRCLDVYLHSKSTLPAEETQII